MWGIGRLPIRNNAWSQFDWGRLRRGRGRQILYRLRLIDRRVLRIPCARHQRNPHRCAGNEKRFHLHDFILTSALGGWRRWLFFSPMDQ